MLASHYSTTVSLAWHGVNQKIGFLTFFFFWPHFLVRNVTTNVRTYVLKKLSNGRRTEGDKLQYCTKKAKKKVEG